MIFAAGLGTRLRPLTEQLPKALVPLAGIPLLEHQILRLKEAGITEIIVNVHHFASQIIDFLQSKRYFGIRIEISDETAQLLDTGGGLKKASWFFDDGKPFVLQNVDVLSTIRFGDMLSEHVGTGAMATLAVSSRSSSRYFLFDESMRLCGWEHTGKQEIRLVGDSVRVPRRFAFSGIHIINPEIFQYIQETGTFSLVDVYLQLSGEFLLKGFEHDPLGWIDLGRPEDLLAAGKRIVDSHFTAIS